MAKNKKRTDGRYQQSFRFDGKRYYCYGHSPDECDKAKTEMIRLLESHSYTTNRKLTLNQYYKEWKQGRVGSIKQATAFQDDILYQHISPVLGERKIIKIERREIIQFRQRLIDIGKLSTATVNNTMVLLHSILEGATTEDIIIKNPVNGIKRLKRTEQPIRETAHRELTQEELDLFFKYSKDSWYYEYFAFLLATGTRASEAAALTWSDIDEINGTISINKTYSQTGPKQFEITTPKTKTSRRIIPLTEESKRVLQLQKIKMFELGGSGAVHLDSRIFSACRGGAITPGIADRTINYVLEKIKEDGKEIPHFAAHAFRHTFASQASRQGMDLNVLKTILGHSSLQMTADLYSHVSEDAKQQEMKKLKISIA
jgi:integrase